VIEGFLGDCSYAAKRDVENMKPDQATRIILGGFATDSLNRDSDDGTAEPPAFFQVGRSLTHELPRGPYVPA
jgi:hypothetical protein